MKTWMAWAAGVSLAAAMGAFTACSGDDSAGGDAGPDATNDGEGIDVVVPDGASDGGADAPSKPDGCSPIDGGFACDPGRVTCGATSCDLAKQYCCITSDGGKDTCTNNPPDSGTSNLCVGGTKAFCDEAADCPNGQICCGFVGPMGGFTTSCQASCGTGIQFCRGSAECTSDSCVAQTCRGESIETCGAFCP